jgi:4-alpha-glucanotransferase
MFQRESGILLHPTCLPGEFGIGDLGADTLRWIKCLDQADQRLWQVLPLSPVGSGFSPYDCTSSLAGNTLLLSPVRLFEQGFLTQEELTAAKLPLRRIQPADVLRKKVPLLLQAARRFVEQVSGEQRDEFEAFQAAQADWLQDFARYEALRETYPNGSWLKWPRALRERAPESLAAADRDLEVRITQAKALQFLFEQQWQSARRIANLKKIRLIGDLPIFVSMDSADVWANQHLFQLRDDGTPKVVAGVPPDYFAKNGQRWGNPLFDWAAHQAEDFAWWARRIQRTLELTDILRIDHFRGFAACWQIPAEDPTAINGHWVPAPGRALFESVQRRLHGELPVFAEDLGIITDDVVALREHFGFPTMRVLQFSFTGEERLLPHRYPSNTVAYTGTHDNDTIVGWYSGDPTNNSTLDEGEIGAERDRFRRYYDTDGTNPHWTAIQRLMDGESRAVLFPFQDVLGAGSEARMNTPGTVGEHNWTWRFDWNDVQPSMLETLKQITKETSRNTV